ncbi:MAG: sugar ABC transporter permease [Rhodoluna sp.]|jgi:alpha-glucoside transport system permease protein|nr:sugar ABC transporter permease [Rhodoluna sp.]
MESILTALAAVVLGPLATFALYYLGNLIVSHLPSQKLRTVLGPYVFIAPVLALVGLFLVYPTIQTMIFAFMNEDSTEFVGVRNFSKLFADPNFIRTIGNNVLWVAVVPLITVILGLMIATLTDKLGPIRERVFKSIVFMPMAISFVAASSVWRLSYSWNSNGPQIGILNAIVQSFGGTPIAWLQNENFSINSLLIMVVVVWANAGFAMTLLSAAIKAVPEETVEAAAIDGATGWQSFYQIVLPQIWGTAVSVFITVLISTMKIFDVIWGMTGGNFHTNVLGVDFFRQYFVYNNTGKAAAVVLLLMIAIIPIMIYQVRTYRKQEEIR